jgi:hypothetical protein
MQKGPQLPCAASEQTYGAERSCVRSTRRTGQLALCHRWSTAFPNSFNFVCLSVLPSPAPFVPGSCMSFQLQQLSQPEGRAEQSRGVEAGSTSVPAAADQGTQTGTQKTGDPSTLATELQHLSLTAEQFFGTTAWPSNTPSSLVQPDGSGRHGHRNKQKRNTFHNFCVAFPTSKFSVAYWADTSVKITFAGFQPAS